MLFFNLKLLEDKARTDIDLYNALYNLYKNKTLKKSRLTKNLVIPNLGKGNSFLINPQSLFETKNIVYASQYIKLAGRRSYMMYSNYGITHLDMSYYPDINLDIIKFNYLLNITNDKIYFKFEG